MWDNEDDCDDLLNPSSAGNLSIPILFLIPPSLSSMRKRRVMLTDRPSFNSDSMWIRKTAVPLEIHIWAAAAFIFSSHHPNCCSKYNMGWEYLSPRRMLSFIFQVYAPCMLLVTFWVSVCVCVGGSCPLSALIWSEDENSDDYWIQTNVQYWIFDLLISCILLR